MYEFPEVSKEIQSKSVLEILIYLNQHLMNSHGMMLALKNKVQNLAQLCQKTKDKVQNLISQRFSTKLISLAPNTQTLDDSSSIQKILLTRQYKYILRMKNNLQSPMYARKNFNIFLALEDLKHQCVDTNDNILLEVLIYSAGKEPTIIQHNRQGEKIIKGNTSAFLTQGYANFEKLSFKEISSKYEKGVFNVVVVARRHMFNKEKEICCQDIQPLIIKDVRVKAKRV